STLTGRTARTQLTSQKAGLPPPQPGDPPGGSFQTANDSTEPNGFGGKAPFAAADQTTSTGLPQSICNPIPNSACGTSSITTPTPPAPPLTGTQNYLLALSNSVS